MTSRKHWLIAKVASEGYCCLRGYLVLCKERGETVQDMAKNIGISPDALWYHYRKFETASKPPGCMRQKDCLDSIIQELMLEKENIKKPPNGGE